MSSSSEETQDDDEQVSVCNVPKSCLATLQEVKRFETLFALVIQTAQGRVVTLAARQEQITPKDTLTLNQERTDAGSKPSCGMFDLSSLF